MSSVFLSRLVHLSGFCSVTNTPETDSRNLDLICCLFIVTFSKEYSAVFSEDLEQMYIFLKDCKLLCVCSYGKVADLEDVN